jgi:D-beta-D-heptose 7-phosphate kinase/D-beta-D-heptose 1-phosphate adenosyltransferase
VVSGSQVITRIDQGSANILDIGSTRTLLTEIERNYDACDAVIISDYDKGLITQPLIQRLGELRKTNNKFLAIDSKRLPSLGILKPSYAKPNYEEALKILGLPGARNRVQQISAHAKKLFRATGAPLITVTLDEEGTVIIEHGRVTHIVPAPEVTRPSVAGAGDAYISAFVLSHLACGDSLRSAEIATAAASIAIRKNSTALCSHAELKSFFNVNTKIITDLRDLEDVCEDYRAAGKRIVFTNGCFDILHSGHVAYLHRAKQMGDVLVVGLNTDDSIRRIKGPDRPINALADRLQVLAGLSSVDHIIPFGHESDDTPIPVIRAVRPDIFAKGGDYTKEKLPEADSVEACGGQIVLIDHVPDHSTTRIINRIASSRQPVDIKPSGKDYDTLERL